MWVKTIKDYRDKETKEIFLSSQNIVREISDERGKELLEKGFVIEMIVKPKDMTPAEEISADESVEESTEDETVEEEPTEDLEVESESEVSE